MNEVRQAIARAAKGTKRDGTTEAKRQWFKREDRGFELGQLVMKHRERWRGGNMSVAVAAIQEFAYEADDWLEPEANDE
jgi:hypothetical protein